jgi:hypothetical protein
MNLTMSAYFFRLIARHREERMEVIEQSWLLPGSRARFGFGRPGRRAPLLGSLLAWA